MLGDLQELPSLLPGRCAPQQQTLDPLLLGHQRQSAPRSHRTAAWRAQVGFCQRKCPTKLPQHCYVLPRPSSPAGGTGDMGYWGHGLQRRAGALGTR